MIPSDKKNLPESGRFFLSDTYFFITYPPIDQ